MPDTVLGAKDIAVNKTLKIPAHMILVGRGFLTASVLWPVQSSQSFQKSLFHCPSLMKTRDYKPARWLHLHVVKNKDGLMDASGH